MVMTIERSATAQRPAPIHPGDDRFVPLAAELAAEFATRAAEHDRENTFVFENYDRMKASGYTRLAVPEELGGLGATMRQVVYAQAELAKGCAATALAVTMHHYNVLAQCFRYRNNVPGAEGVLRRVANDDLILMTSGGSDGIWPSSVATRVDGGYRVNGRKVFCSQAPVANVMSTMARYDDPDDGPVVLLMSVPLRSEGVEMQETWDTLGMRATSSNDLVFNDVFVSDAQIVTRRPWGKNDPALRNALVHFAPLGAAVYWGIAAGARDEALRVVTSRPGFDGVSPTADPLVQRRVGMMQAHLQNAWWALLGSVEQLGDDYKPNPEASNIVTIAKAEVVTKAVQVVDLAMETVGGAAF
ncbi:MAG TPA: acyl-CoA dehydrogenase family protein, partial [Thermomicrobiales bacterium]|nr:acyl-CoA dehydrogenase family protein [Thermomicrobiales bacterium]